jgi:hypothetical protein
MYLFVIIAVLLGLWLLVVPHRNGGRNAKNLGVVIHEKTKAYPGLNLYNSRHLRIAHLFDNNGREFHSWQSKVRKRGGWQHAVPGPNGVLYAVEKNRAVVKLDWHSKEVWQKEGMYHHDVAVLDSGELVALERVREAFDIDGHHTTVLNDYIVYLSESGIEQRRVSLYPLFKRFVSSESKNAAVDFSQMADREEITNDTPADLFHFNSLEVLRAREERGCAHFFKRVESYCGCRYRGFRARLALGRG